MAISLFSFVSRARFDDMLREKNNQIGERDHRITQLEAERRMLCDKILNVAFQPNKKTESHEPATAAESGAEESAVQEIGADKSSAGREPIPHRPSQIMRRMDRLAQERWLRKIHPAKVAEEERNQILR
jgi:hypothetical protein